MENTSYIALSGLTALRREVDVIANNIANANTTAYRAERTLFEEYLADLGNGLTASFVLDQGQFRDPAEGPITHTGAGLDFAISGKGYFVVETVDGLRYTRAGHFKLDLDGILVTASGHPVLDDGGRAIRFPAGDHQPSVDSEGVLSTETGTLGRFDIVTFDDEQLLRKVGDGLYAADAPSKPALEAIIHQGMIEGSNVQPILEMTEMIRLVRRYQATQKLMEQADELRRKAVEQLAGSA